MRGTKTERSAGIWRLRVYLGDDPVTGNPRQATRTFKGSKKQADTALANFVAEVSTGRAASPSTVTVSEFLDQWIDQIRPSRQPTTIRGYRNKINRLNSKLGKLRLNRLTAQALDRAYREWLDEGLHPNTVHHLHSVLSAALNQAVKWGVVPYAVTERASPPPLRSHSKQIPTPDVIQLLITTAEERGQPVLAAAIAVAATTGMRRGELVGLQWPDIDFADRSLLIRRSVKHDDGPGWVLGPPKSHQQRKVSLDPFTLAVLEEHRSRAEGWAGDAQVRLAREAFVFSLDPSCSEPFLPDSLSQAFARICDRAGVEDVSLHTLRHFSASVLVASGRDVRTIAGRLGHAEASTTLRIYSHMVEGRDRDAAEFLGQLLSGTTGV
jgi:integrase